MSDFDPRRAADALHDIRAGKRKLTSLPSEIAPRTPAEAAVTQRALAERAGQAEPAGFRSCCSEA